MPIRSLCKEMIPPLLLRLMRGERIKTRLYENWSQARNAARGDYEDEEITTLVQFRTDRFRQTPQTELSISVLQSAAAIAIAQNNRNHLNVIDFGGACGIYFLQLKQLFPQIRFDWRVVETPAMVKAGAELHLSPELSFHTELDEAICDLDEIDLVHTSSTLGFLEDSYGTLERLFQTDCRYLLASRNTVAETPKDFIVIHRHPLSNNGYGKELPPGFREHMVAYPQRLISRIKLERLLKQYGDFLFSCDDPSAMQNYPGLTLAGRSYLVKRR